MFSLKSRFVFVGLRPLIFSRLFRSVIVLNSICFVCCLRQVQHTMIKKPAKAHTANSTQTAAQLRFCFKFSFSFCFGFIFIFYFEAVAAPTSHTAHNIRHIEVQGDHEGALAKAKCKPWRVSAQLLIMHA